MTEWSNDEVDILIGTYEEHGPSWVGYESLLPGRTRESIRSKANSLGITCASNKRMLVSREDELEVMRHMRAGLAPSRIDELM